MKTHCIVFVTPDCGYSCWSQAFTAASAQYRGFLLQASTSKHSTGWFLLDVLRGHVFLLLIHFFSRSLRSLEFHPRELPFLVAALTFTQLWSPLPHQLLLLLQLHPAAQILTRLPGFVLARFYAVSKPCGVCRIQSFHPK